MSGLAGRNIIVGVTGSIAAYKAAVLVRELTRCGSNVRVVMTESASHFITPLTLSSLSRHRVAIDMHPSSSEEPASGSWHIDWALWADAMVIAPASAATIARLATGLAENALTVIATALRGALFVAPAMDHDMYRYPAVTENLRTLRRFGAVVIPPEEGELASGLIGPGRMSEPATIVGVLDGHFTRRATLRGRHVLITAGPTHEPIDPVRFISNRSSGRMGYALAEEARARGARVTLVSGPVEIDPPAGVVPRMISTAEEMARAVDDVLDDVDIVIAAAAVSDFAPVEVADRKLKRREMTDDRMRVELRPTRDILRSIGERRRDDQVIVGFALETDGLLESARAKLIEKQCDIIVANPADDPEVGMGVELNRITLVTASGERQLPTATKRECAAAIFDAIEDLGRDGSRQRAPMTSDVRRDG